MKIHQIATLLEEINNSGQKISAIQLCLISEHNGMSTDATQDQKDALTELRRSATEIRDLLRIFDKDITSYSQYATE